MCGRYSLFVPPEDLEERFDAAFADPFSPTYNVAPGQRVPVVTDEAPAAIRQLEWGLVPSWADGDADRLINARAETVAETRSFRAAYRQQGTGRSEAETADSGRETPAAGRCLVIADGFYEWTPTDAGNQPYRIGFGDDRPFAMAGLWERREPPADESQTGLDDFGAGIEAGRTDSGPLETVTILTMAPNDLVADIHDRMPAILARGEEDWWFDAADPVADLEPHPSDEMRAYPVSTAVNDPTRDDPSLVEPIDASGES